jgi:hypothetical protein
MRCAAPPEATGSRSTSVPRMQALANNPLADTFHKLVEIGRSCIAQNHDRDV